MHEHGCKQRSSYAWADLGCFTQCRAPCFLNLAKITAHDDLRNFGCRPPRHDGRQGHDGCASKQYLSLPACFPVPSTPYASNALSHPCWFVQPKVFKGRQRLPSQPVGRFSVNFAGATGATGASGSTCSTCSSCPPGPTGMSDHLSSCFHMCRRSGQLMVTPRYARLCSALLSSL